MKGAGVLSNHCSKAIGVELKMIALDKNDTPIASKDFWPASVQNIPPGDYTFTLDHHIDYDPRIKAFSLEPIRVREWNR